MRSIRVTPVGNGAKLIVCKCGGVGDTVACLVQRKIHGADNYRHIWSIRNIVYKIDNFSTI